MSDGRYIVALDMEWNQPLPWKQYPRVPKAMLPGEIIQIGAVKVDPAGEAVDEMRLSVRPRYFKQVHWKVKKLTRLSEEEMMNGIPFPEAAEKLGAWLCATGPDFDIFAWGGEDERILTANLEAWGLDPDWLPRDIYDARFIYDSFLGRDGVSTSLTDAAAELGAELELDQHDSLNDARYLAAICRKTDLRRGMAEYEELGPAPAPGQPLQRLRLADLADQTEVLKERQLRSFTCPRCGKELFCREWVPQNKDRQIALTACACGEKCLSRIHWKPRPNGTLSVVRTVYEADAETEDFYKKRLQRYLSAQKHAKKAKEKAEAAEKNGGEGKTKE